MFLMRPYGMGMSSLLSRRALNRATLDRQLLLHRSDMPVVKAVDHLVGLQAQTPHTWYVGLWSRLAGFRPEEVGDLLTTRQLVRIALMRSTIHLVTAGDALALRPLVQVVIERSTHANYGKRLAGVVPEDLVAAARAWLAEKPRTFSELGRALAPGFPGRDPEALAIAVRAWVPLVQVPPRGVWGASGRAAHACLDGWVGGSPAGYPVAEMVLRYLAAFGPASVRDVQIWSGLTRLGEVVEALRPRLVSFRDERGVELFDLPDAPRPDPDTPAPPRFLYDFDNLLLSHADRGRVITEECRQQDFEPHGPVPRLVLLDGFTAATWTVESGKGTASLLISPFGRLSTRDKSALATEGRSLLAFLAPKAAAGEVRFTA
jgi:hypothetical protein